MATHDERIIPHLLDKIDRLEAELKEAKIECERVEALREDTHKELGRVTLSLTELIVMIYNQGHNSFPVDAWNEFQRKHPRKYP